MSLTWKLICGFLFALVLQVVQMLTSGYFTVRMQTASEQVSDALTSCLAVQAAIDATREIQRRVDGEIGGRSAFDISVGRVYVDEVQQQVTGLSGSLDTSHWQGLDILRRCVVKVELGMRELVTDGPGEARRDGLLFLSDDVLELEQALFRTQVRVREVGRRGIEVERSVHDLPFRAAMAITLAGVVVMAAFVLWYKRQMVVPIQRAWAELEQRVQDRTAELAAARDAAFAANRTKTAFLANISHELRTPMTAIVGFSELLAECPTGSDGVRLQGEAIATVRRNAHALVAIVNDLLDMSKLEAGKLQVEPVPCSPLQVVDDVLGLMRAKADAAGVVLRSVVPQPVPVSVRTDPLRLRQILVNLIDNAIKFSGGGEVTVTIGLVTDAELPKLSIEVADRGIGMSDAVLARLFQPFEQADVSITRRYGGTGLGLAISRQLANLLGGDLVATSVVGEGSKFSLQIATGPLAGVEMTRTAVLLPVPAAKAPRQLDGTSVLLVEDGPDNQRLVRHVLERAGCRVEIVGNGQECLDRMAQPAAAFDVVLMDMQMPVMDGITATRTLRAGGCKVPILSLTANAMQVDRDAALAAGCDAFLTKPIDRKLLTATIAEWRGRGAPART
jgi:signal transduction histidine kinase/CheY-like chemotaxis protein